MIPKPSVMLPAIGARPGAAGRHLLVSVALSSAFVTLLCLAFDPVWETNDDVAMSMVAHGYGIAEYGSPYLIFSNVLWGAIVRGLPSIDGLLGYSIATLLALTLAGAATIFFLLRTGTGYLVSVLVLALVFTRPVLFPQFTITAGLLTVTMMLGLLAYDRDDSLFNLIAACCLGFLACLIRSLELVLVIGVGWPLLPWRKLARSRAACLAVSVLAVCIAAAAMIDVWAYSGPEWRSFWQSNFARAPFTDFGAVDHVLQYPDVVRRLGLSENDVRLIGSYFFADPRLIDPELLKTLLREVPMQITSKTNFASGFSSVLAMFGHQLLPLVFTGACLLLLLIRPGLLLAWVTCLLVMFALGVLGRPGTARVFIPLFSLLAVIPSATTFLPSRSKFIPVAGILLVGCVINGVQSARDAVANDALLPLARPGKFISPSSTVVWGDGLPFQYVFPVFTREADLHDTRIYGLGVFTLAPFSVPFADERFGQGLLARLRSQAGIPLIADINKQSLLNTYCVEHYGTPLRLSNLKKPEMWNVVNASCAPAEGGR